LPPPLTDVVQVCGRLFVELGRRRIDPLLPGRQGRLLFVFLILNRTRDVTAGELVEAVWPGEQPAGADATLRSLISKVRRVVGPDALARGGEYRLGLPPGVHVDLEVAVAAIHRAETAVAAGDWHRAWGPSQVALFTARRGFLFGYEAPWIDAQRRALADLELRAVECYAAASLGVGGVELAGAERTARKLVEREPFRESGYRILMQALAERGNVADALLVYDDLATRLRDQLGVDPSVSTKNVHRDLLRLV
jgi:DNA-binding SARP family transcriptional activator